MASLPADLHRPAYHFTPVHWMNDPILFHRPGEYHVFYQHNPNGAFWGTMHWGHTFSRDLLTWEDLPIALAPELGSPDADGVFTGCAVEADGCYAILYTGIPRLHPTEQVQCLAWSDDLVSWRKDPRNPVIATQPGGFGDCFRDPQAWREGDRWRMVIGSQIDGQGGAALLYESHDLAEWTYLGPLFVGRTEETGFDFECPDFFPLGDRHVLITSRGQTFWHAGRYAGTRFERDAWGTTDSGQFYAAKTLVDDRGRRILFGWITESRPDQAQRAAGWSGALSLPRQLTLRPDGTLGIEPVEELAALRGPGHSIDRIVTENGRTPLEGVQGDTLELHARFQPSSAEAFGVAVRCSPDGAERTEIAFRPNEGRFVNAPLRLQPGETLDVRIFVDRSVIETFANGRACHTLRVYPERADALGVEIFARGGSASATVEAWELQGGGVRNAGGSRAR